MDNFLSQTKAAKLLGISAITLMRYRQKGFFDGAIQLPSIVLYSVHQLQDFLESDLKRPYVRQTAQTKTSQLNFQKLSPTT